MEYISLILRNPLSPNFYPIISSPPSLIVSLSSLLIGYYIVQRRQGVRRIKEISEETNNIYRENTREYKKVLLYLPSKQAQMEIPNTNRKRSSNTNSNKLHELQGLQTEIPFFNKFILRKELLYLSLRGGACGLDVHLSPSPPNTSITGELKKGKSHCAQILMQHMKEYLFKELIIVWKQSVCIEGEGGEGEKCKLGEKEIQEELRRHQRVLGHVINFEWCSLCSLHDTNAHGVDA